MFKVLKIFGFVVKVLVNSLIPLFFLNLLVLLLSSLVGLESYINHWINMFLFFGLLVFEFFRLKKQYFIKETEQDVWLKGL